MKNKLHVIFLLVLMTSITSMCFSIEFDGVKPLGPLGGRNMYALHLPWFSFSAEKAGAFESNSLVVRTGLYHLNDFKALPLYNPNGKLSSGDQQKYIIIDYESTILEIGVDWQIVDRIRVSSDWRLHARYGGYSDLLIEGFHNILGFPNAGREHFDRNQSRWNIQTTSGFGFSHDQAIIASGDWDLRAIWTFLETAHMNLGLSAAFKIPLGYGYSGFGSNYPDIGLAILADWMPWKRWIFYGNMALIFPFGESFKVMWQFIPAVEFRISPAISLVLQFNLQTQAISGIASGDRIVYGESMQTDIKVGIKGQHDRFSWQFYVEEDPFTFEGPDILIFFDVSYRFNL